MSAEGPFNESLIIGRAGRYRCFHALVFPPHLYICTTSLSLFLTEVGSWVLCRVLGLSDRVIRLLRPSACEAYNIIMVQLVVVSSSRQDVCTRAGSFMCEHRHSYADDWPAQCLSLMQL